MKKKINIANVILLASLSAFLPIKSFAIYPNNSDNTQVPDNPQIYLGTNYKLSISHFTDFSVQESYRKVDIIGLKSNVPDTKYDTLRVAENFNTEYNPVFKNNFSGLSGTLGYYSDKGFRLELEASYQNFDVKPHKNYNTENDAYRYFALVRNKAKDAFQPEKDVQDSAKNYRSFYSFMRNDGVSITSVMFSGCYDLLLNNDLKISSYACAGIGGDFIEFFNAIKIKFAYQAKLGISYSLSPSVHVFADTYYHKSVGNQFKNLRVQYAHTFKYAPFFTSAEASLNVGYFGGELGFRFIF
ncbi:P44/Msp2 family outer membrane protein [Ehrlichia ruminantium]|uniref:P44/Msp2 family outer membrane protein n=1 Tax=Ehrlichia ruminantium TaxID=779 RepID=A0AAE6UIT4_EHRRU|nr:P44/Msp2 family outer membrane protein [Ehrlichia ruminantium]QGR02928.1 P44/Msp2 family outer membrane protein [Ehrlichia ruminantium]QGR03852.1 P44/Msp2 family outer membrane protein [Ehrlichia ruminantium]QGR04779.1 P44/Msp2 family outer membrane protein [Ehrlichia ruminantium]